MLRRLISTLFLLSTLLPAASEWVRIRTTDGTVVEGSTAAKAIGKIPLPQVLAVYSGSPATDSETAKITAGIATIQGTDRAARDKAVEELTSLGIPVFTPLLKTYKDTDQHEPRPLYRLFERIMPGYADSFDRSLSLVRLTNGTAQRLALPEGSLDIIDGSGHKTAIAWSKIRTLAVRQKTVKRTMQVHSLKHCTQIEFLDTGVVLTATSKATLAAQGLVRMSWDTDSWASDANGIKVPGAPAYKSNLFEGHPFGSLVGRIEPAGENFFVGTSANLTSKAGRLRLAVNDNPHWQNNLGTFHVTMTATDAYDMGDAQ